MSLTDWIKSPNSHREGCFTLAAVSVKKNQFPVFPVLGCSCNSCQVLNYTQLKSNS